jgi:isopentenyl-diphosphate delta-isomerase
MTTLTTSEPLTSTNATTAEGERDRKLEHIQLSLEQRMQLGGRFFDRYGFVHEALPEIDLREIDLTTTFLGKKLEAPLLVSCMTGGTASASLINRHLAEGAEDAGIALGVGSQRKALEDPITAASFEVRRYAPSIPLLGNLGAVQLNYGFGLEECRRAVQMIEADGLALHLNPLQEALQPEGQCDFRNLTAKIGEIARELEVPVVVKEIGCGISASTARRLAAVGVKILDTAGLGGTSWARIEAARADDLDLGELFAEWGVPSPESILQLATIPNLQLIGSGGIRNGVDIAKAIALGADLVGLAQPFLKAAMESSEAVAQKIERLLQELKIAMFCVGARTLTDLRQLELVRKY